jgi:hypothetical protein
VNIYDWNVYHGYYKMVVVPPDMWWLLWTMSYGMSRVDERNPQWVNQSRPVVVVVKMVVVVVHIAVVTFPEVTGVDGSYCGVGDVGGGGGGVCRVIRDGWGICIQFR